MATNNVVRVQNYLRKELTTTKPSGDVVRFELRHIGAGSKYGKEVAGPWPLPEKVDISEFAETVAAEMVTAAEGDAEGSPDGVIQKYIVLPFRAKNPDKSQGRCPFYIAPPDEDDDNADSEPATKAGSLAQQMRHNEALMRVLMTGMQGMMQSQARMVASVTDENHKLREQQLEMHTAIGDFLQQKEERALRIEESKARTALMAEGANKLMQLAPVAINRMMGGKPEGKALVLMQVADKLTALAPEKKMKIAQALSDELDEETQLAVLELLQNAGH